MLRNILSVICSLSIAVITHAQTEDWDSYLDKYDKGQASVVLNLALKNDAPKKDLPFIVITGVTSRNCSAAGFPGKAEFDLLYKIADTIEARIKSLGNVIFAGTFTYQCQRLNYYYVNDTSRMRKTLSETYTSKFKPYEYYIEIKSDANWLTYLNFLYPKEDIQDEMYNKRVIRKLQSEGDQLIEARKIDHWFYFKNEKDREDFIATVLKSNYKIEAKRNLTKTDPPLQLQISRTDRVDIASITALTKELKALAKKYNGEYAGWEPAVVR